MDLPRKLFMLIVPDGTPANARTLAWFRLIVVVDGSPSSVLTWDIDIVPVGNVMLAPYGVPYAVMLAADVMLPDESMEAITVDPYLKTSLPPDSIIEKFDVTKFAALVAFVALVAVAAFPLMLIFQVPEALVPVIDGAPTVL